MWTTAPPPASSAPFVSVLKLDAVIFGGGVAGLWTLARLRAAGYRAVLLESQALAAGQTRHAQGIIHGGTKYALAGTATDSSEAIAAMPGLWRACFDGRGELDLSSAKIWSEHQYMWSTARLSSRVAGFFASKLMRGRTESVAEAERPLALRGAGFKGQVYRLDEPVLDVASLIHALAEPQREAIWALPEQWQLSCADDGVSLELQQADGQCMQLEARRVVLAAGAGNAELLKTLGRDVPAMQRRPLQMVMVRGPLPGPLYAHCIDGSKTRVTITSHLDRDGQVVWYLGGQLSEDGAKMSAAELLARAKSEMKDLFPDIDWSQAQWATLAIDRAEHRQSDGSRPAEAYIKAEGVVMTAWPVKLAFAPIVAATVLAELEQAGVAPGEAMALPAWPHPGYADLPWMEEARWS